MWWWCRESDGLNKIGEDHKQSPPPQPLVRGALPLRGVGGGQRGVHAPSLPPHLYPILRLTSAAPPRQQCHGAMKTMGLSVDKNGDLVISNKKEYAPPFPPCPLPPSPDLPLRG